jgi:RecB family exonuclease
LEECLDNNKRVDHKELSDSFINNVSSYDPDNKIPKELIDVGSQILDEFYDEYQDIDFNIYEKELGFKFIIGTYLVVGYIDRVDLIDEKTIKIIDYKTGKWEVSQKGVKDNLQLGIYALAVSEIFPDKEITAELHYLRSGKRKGHTFSKEDIENVKSRLIESISEVVNDSSFHPTKNEFTCSFCEHAKSGACNTGVFRNKKRAKA